MIENLMGELEAKIRAAQTSEAGKSELLQALAKLKAELAARDIPDDTREKLKSLKSPMEELRSSMQGFEQSHPKLVETVNNISNTLSNLGI